MCGYVSIYYKNESYKLDIENIAEKLNHRGPNYTGIFKQHDIEFAFKRISIVDIENGNQPLEKDNKVIVFNGEIYNYINLREELIQKGYKFNSNCDTEVLLTLYIELGEKCIDKLRGMYSFIIYDKDKGYIFGARDNFGIKPLYYTENEDLIAFSSEYKSIINILEEKQLNKKSLQSYLSFQFVPFEDTMIKGIKVVPPGHSFSIKDGKIRFKKVNEIKLNSSENINRNDVREVVIKSIENHMDANDEVGTFLSGGIDSTIVAAIAARKNPNIKSFSVGFGIEGYDETEVAKRSADKLNIENIEVKVSQEDYIKALPKIVYHLDDPIADPSEVGIYFLSKEASKYVTVVLSGEGADELFGGYNIYKEYNSVKPVLNMSKSIKNVIHKLSDRMPNIKGKSYLNRCSTQLRDRYIGNAKIFENDEVQKILRNYEEKYKYQNILQEVYLKAQKENYDYVTTMQYVDINTWLEGDILQKADKMSMASSIELRVPFLDKEVLDLARNLKLQQKISSSNTKILLREAFKDIVPDFMVKKKKLGFPTPIRV